MKVRRPVRIALVVLAVFLVFLPLLLSKIIQYSLVSELERRGMTAIAVEKLWLNPYTGVASIDTLKFSKDDEDYHVTGLELDVGLMALLQRKVRVSGIRLVSARLVVQQDADGNLLINGISLASDTTQEVVEDVVSEEPETVEGESATWQFALDSVGVEDVQVLVDLPELLADVAIEKIAIARLDTSEQESADVELQLTLNRLVLPASEMEASVAVTMNTLLVLERLAATDWLVSAETELQLAELLVSTPQAAVKLPDTRLQLEAAAAYGKALWTLAAKTRTRLSNLEVTAADADIQLPETVIELDLDAKAEGAEQGLSAQTKVTLTDVKVAAADTQVQLPQLALTAEATAKSAGESWDVTGQSRTVLSDLEVVSPQAAVTLANTELQVEGQALVGEPLDYQGKLTLVATEAAVQDGSSAAALANLQQLDLAAAIQHRQKGDVVSVKQLLLTGLNLLPGTAQPTLVSEAKLQLEGMTVQLPTDDQNLDVVVERISLPQATVRFVRDAQGKLPQLAAVLGDEAAATETTGEAPVKDAEPKPEAANNESAEKTPVLIKQLSIGPEVAIHVSDEGIKPAFKEKVQFSKLEVKNLSLQDEKLPAQLSMLLQLSHDAAFKAEGSFNAVAPSADVNITLDEYQLLSLSGYSEQFTGYALESGVFSLNSAVKVAADQLDTKNEAIITHVSLRPEHAATAERFAHSLTMPLDQALDLLRDSKNQIKLEVPVTGALNDPNVDLQQVINKALSGAVKKASMLVLKTMLQPYGALISVAQMAGEKMTQVTLAPVQFAAGKAELDNVAKDYAGKLAAMINEREALTLTLCGVSNRQDLGALLGITDAAALTAEVRAEQEPLQREALTALAGSRTEAFRHYLQSEHGVKTKQLVVCLPKYSSKTNAVSGVELSF